MKRYFIETNRFVRKDCLVRQECVQPIPSFQAENDQEALVKAKEMIKDREFQWRDAYPQYLKDEKILHEGKVRFTLSEDVNEFNMRPFSHLD